MGNSNGCKRVSIHRQSRWLYGCWPLKGAFSQPNEAKARTKAKASYCFLHCRSTGNSKENILPEFSKFYCHPGRAGGSPSWNSSTASAANACGFLLVSKSKAPRDQHRARRSFWREALPMLASDLPLRIRPWQMHFQESALNDGGLAVRRHPIRPDRQLRSLSNCH